MSRTFVVLLNLLVGLTTIRTWQIAGAQTILNTPKSSQSTPAFIEYPSGSMPVGASAQLGAPGQSLIPAQVGVPAQSGIPTQTGQPARPNLPSAPATPGSPGTLIAPMKAPGWLVGVMPEMQALVLRSPVVLYTPENCGQPCDEAGFWLLERGIPFLTARVESAADLNAFRRLGFGVGFPALAVGQRRVSGFQEPHWENALNQAGFPKLSRLPPGWQPPPPYPLSVLAQPDGVSRGTPPPSALIPQKSAIAVDRNQAEQMLFREENDALRKRLDEQRRAQELALAEQTTRASTEAARLKAQTEAALQRQKELEQQLGSSAAPPPASISMGKRIALVIGNAKYNIRPLQNPVNDADDVSKALKASGFDVLDLRNASLREMIEGARMFGDMLKSHDVGLVYYSGHGIEVKGRNYFIPVNADIKREDEVAYQSLDVGLILEKMATANKSVNIMIVDACRDDPFGRSFRSASSGLAAVDAPKGSLIAFATSPGKVAADGDGRNSPYTKYLVRAMQQPNKKIEEVFKEVRRAVQAETKDQQTPWENTSLSGDFYFRVQR